MICIIRFAFFMSNSGSQFGKWWTEGVSDEGSEQDSGARSSSSGDNRRDVVRPSQPANDRQRTPARPNTSTTTRMQTVRPPGSVYPEATGYTMVATGVRGRLESVFPSESPSSSRSFSQRVEIERKRPQLEAMRGKLLLNSTFFKQTCADGTSYADLMAELLCIDLVGVTSYDAAEPILTQFFARVDASAFYAWLKEQRFNHNLSPLNDPQRKTTPWRLVSPANSNQRQWNVFNPASRASDQLPLFKILFGLDL